MAKSVAYVPGQTSPHKMSRSKIEMFIRCPRCFVLDAKLGIKQPPGIPFTLNVAVDNLMKKEFDSHRAAGTVPEILKQNKTELVPFQHPDLNKWRHNFTGVQHTTSDNHFTIYGAVDDLWVDSNGVIYVVDYKATGRQQAVTELGEGGFYDGYRRQLEIYQWLLRKNGFEVSNTGYWVYVTATQKEDSFNNTLHFESNLVSYEGNSGWIDSKLEEIYLMLNEEVIPGPAEDCDLCKYFDTRAIKTEAEGDLIWPFCVTCNKRMSKTLYGMPSGPPPAGYLTMGCIVGFDDPEWICTHCEPNPEFN
jgi:hypothetical protein